MPVSRPRRALVVAATLVVVVTTLGIATKTSPAGASGGQRTVSRAAAGRALLPTGLPGHFGFGVAAGPGSDGVTGWMPGSGVPWDYAYTYLAGGVNTGAGWQTWNANVITESDVAMWQSWGVNAVRLSIN